MFHMKPGNVYTITPIGKPAVRGTKQKFIPEPYPSFKIECQLKRVEVPSAGAHITFVFPMPKSWSKRKKAEMDGQPHTSKPDLDNCMKALGDAVHGEDCHIWDYRLTKIWGQRGEIRVEEI